jgi:hypothetical protein
MALVNFHCSLNDVSLTPIQKQSNIVPNVVYLQLELQHQSLVVKKTQVQKTYQDIACMSEHITIFFQQLSII